LSPVRDRRIAGTCGDRSVAAPAENTLRLDTKARIEAIASRPLGGLNAICGPAWPSAEFRHGPASRGQHARRGRHSGSRAGNTGPSNHV